MSAATPPTPENVAEMLTSGDNDYHDGNYWHPSIGAQGNVVHIGITAYSEDGKKLPEHHFRAVVVEGETEPIVLDRATFEQRVNERFDAAIRKLGCESLTFVPATIAALRAQILALDVDLAGDVNGGDDDA